MNELAKKKCIPCEGGAPPLPTEQRERLLNSLHSDWQLTNDKTRLKREFKFDDYKKSFEFVSQVSVIAEDQWHHPDIKLGWGYAEVEIYTCLLYTSPSPRDRG